MGFAALVPGTISGGWNDIHISGSPATTYRVFMDGLDDTSAVKGAISDEQQPSVESLGSESVMINNYSAKYGESGGGIFNYTSKSGTNRLHGTAFGYIENEDLDAGQPFNYTSSGQKYNPVQRQLDFGGSFGGPVVDSSPLQRPQQNLLLLRLRGVPQHANPQQWNHYGSHGSLSQWRSELSLAGSHRGFQWSAGRGLPGPADDQWRSLQPGDDQNVATCTNGSTAVVRDPFPNNFHWRAQHMGSGGAEGSRLHACSIRATANALTNNYPNLQPNNKYQYLTSIKIDHSIGEKWHLSGYGILEYGDKDNAADGINGVGASTRWNTTPPRSCISMRTIRPRRVLYSTPDSTSRAMRRAGFGGAELQGVDSWVEHGGKYARRRCEHLPDLLRAHHQPSERSAVGNQQRSVH
jgi:hypothetical protein